MHIAERKHGKKKSAEDKKVNIKKIGSGLIVAMSMLAFNAAASDECGTAITNIKLAAENLRCVGSVEGNTGLWDPNNPIWQKAAGKGKGKNSDPDMAGDGCEVHQNLARLLYEKPVVKESNGKGGNKPKNPNEDLGRGAARALEDHQYDYAVTLLDEFVRSIDSSALNPELELNDLYPDFVDPAYVGKGEPGDAEYWAVGKARYFATQMIVAINGDGNLSGCRP